MYWWIRVPPSSPHQENSLKHSQRAQGSGLRNIIWGQVSFSSVPAVWRGWCWSFTLGIHDIEGWQRSQ